MDLLAEKVTNLRKKSSKMQILTLAAQNWTIQGTAQFFNVSEYLVRSARKLANQKGILALPVPKKTPDISKSTIALLESFIMMRNLQGKCLVRKTVLALQGIFIDKKGSYCAI